MYAPAGTYHVNVWPHLDSNYISFDQQYYVVTGDTTKDITLSSGYKLSGYLTDQNGAPIQGASVWLNGYGTGWYSNAQGYYFATAPAGTYTLKITPRTGPTFETYIETSFQLDKDTTKNIILNQQKNNPSLSSTISMTVNAKFLNVGSTLTTNGKLTDQNGNPIGDKTIILSYSVESGIWTQVGSGKTNASGTYSIEWLIPASGTFTLKAEWAGNFDYAKTSATTTLTITV
jgi:protocatechuate 3,4-dioxygenase beta subunit